jgi:radical SAM protein (TIGR01212 family)
MGEASQEPVFRDYSGFLRERYGEALYRVPLDLGLSCPNRRADGAGGCTYCAPRRCASPPPLAEQIERGIRGARERYGAAAFMAYFQAFTSTHAPAAVLRPLFAEALAGGQFRAVTIATRPDCLPEETLDLLAELAATYDLWVELGVQTLHDRTLEAIRRGHDSACSEQAVRALAARGIPVVPHLILGLPGEEMEQYRETARRLAGWPCAGVKIHNLHIVAGSELAEAWKAGLVRLLDEHEYAAALIEVLRRLPPSWPILRLSSDTPRDQLLAPRWWFGKAQFRQYIERRMREQGWRQGDLLTPKPQPAARVPAGKTQPLRQPEAAPPAEPKIDLGRPFAAAVRLPRPAPGRSFAVLDLGFGTGNLLLDLLPILLERVTENPLRVVGLGWDRSLVDALRRRNPEYDRQLAILGAGCALHDGHGAAVVQWGDPRRNLFRLRGRAELVVVEPRLIEPNVTLFTQDFLCRVARLLVPGGVLLALSDHPALRGALGRLGLTVGRTETNLLPDGGTVASWQPEAVLHPLAAEQLRTCTATLAGVPYRDRSLTWSQPRILEHRANVLARLYRTPKTP